MTMLKKTLGVVVGFGLINLLAFSGNMNRGERGFKVLELEKGKSYTYTVDLAKQGPIKKLLQSGTYSINFKLKTKDNPQLKLKADKGNMELYLSQGYKKGLWPPLQEDAVLMDRGARSAKVSSARKPVKGTELPLNVELRVPESNRAKAGEAKLVFYEAGKEYATINIKVINSKV